MTYFDELMIFLYATAIFFGIIVLYYAIKHISSDPHKELLDKIKNYESNCTQKDLQPKYHFKNNDAYKHNEEEEYQKGECHIKD